MPSEVEVEATEWELQTSATSASLLHWSGSKENRLTKATLARRQASGKKGKIRQNLGLFSKLFLLVG